MRVKIESYIRLDKEDYKKISENLIIKRQTTKNWAMKGTERTFRGNLITTQVHELQ